MHNDHFSPEKGFYSVKDFCQWASIGTTTFYNLVGAGKITTVKIGAKTLVSYPEALRFASGLIEAANDNGNKKEGAQ